MVECGIHTPHFPTLSILQNNRFEPAPNGTSAMSKNVARIFDAQAIAADPPPKSLGTIPLSDNDPEYPQERYWRLPVKIEAILASLVARVGTDICEAEEVRWAQAIVGTLLKQRIKIPLWSPAGGGPSGSGRPRGGGGSSRGGGFGRSRGGKGGPKGGDESGVPKRALRSSGPVEPAQKRGRTKRGASEGMGEKRALKSRSLEMTERELSDQSGEYF